MTKTKEAIDAVENELAVAAYEFPPMASPHEGYAILLEEVDELWDEIKMRPALRSKEDMYNEAKQVAAMAIRFMVDVCG